MSYRPNYLMYSVAPTGWHDEPYEYVFNFQNTLAASVTNPRILDFGNYPLNFDPDADFYMRGAAILIDAAPATYVGGGNVTFNMRLRDPFGRPLDDNYVPMQAYFTTPFSVGPSKALAGAPVATPIYAELYCPASCVMYADFQAQGVSGATFKTYSFHIYFKGVKRFQNEECKP